MLRTSLLPPLYRCTNSTWTGRLSVCRRKPPASIGNMQDAGCPECCPGQGRRVVCSDLHTLYFICSPQLNFAARCISSLVSSSPARRFSLNRPIRRNRAIISSSPKWLLCSNSGSSAKATRATSTNIRAVIPKTRYRVVGWPASSCSCSCSASLSTACFWLRVRLRGLTTDLSRIGTKNWCTRRY